MKVDLEKVSTCRMRLNVEIPDSDLKKEIESIYKDISKSAKIPGFRSGKAPRAVLEKRYSQEAKGELFKKVIPEAYSKALEEKKLQPVGHPKVEVTEYKENEVLRFKAELDIQPEVKLKNYSGFALTQKKVKVEDKDVEQTINNLQQQHARYEAITDRGLKFGDFAIVDWEMECEGNKVETVNDRWIPIDKKYYLEKFCDPLVGAKGGEERDVEVTLPKEYPNELLRGKKALFHIKVKEIKERILPELNDDFAKDLGKFDTFQKLKEELKKQLETHKEKEEQKEVKAQVVKLLLKDYSFELPGFLVENMSQDILNRALNQMQAQKVPQKEIEEQRAKLAEKANERAEAEVRLAYLTDAIANKESIKVEKEDFEKYMMEMAQMGQNQAYLQQFFQKPENVENLRAQLLEEKVLQFLISQGKIKVE